MKIRTICTVAISAAIAASAAGASAQSGSTSASGTAANNYASSKSDGAMSLQTLAGMPKTVPAFPVPVKIFSAKFFKGKTKIYLPTYGLMVVRSGEATASSNGFGSTAISRRSTIQTVLVGVDEDLAIQLAKEARDDLAAKLKAAGYDVVLGLPAGGPAPLGAQAKGKTGAPGQPVYAPPDAPLLPGVPFLQPAGTAYNAATEAGPDGIVLLPGIGVDYERLESSGRSNFLATSASVGAKLRFHAIGGSGATFATKPAPPYRGAWSGYMAVENGAGTDEPFAIMNETDDKSDSRALSTAFALAGMGNMYRQKKVYTVQADPDRFAALTRAAFQGLNDSIVAEIRKAAS